MQCSDGFGGCDNRLRLVLYSMQKGCKLCTVWIHLLAERVVIEQRNLLITAQLRLEWTITSGVIAQLAVGPHQFKGGAELDALGQCPACFNMSHCPACKAQDGQSVHLLWMLRPQVLCIDTRDRTEVAKKPVIVMNC
ncbi:hypothetical protein SDC9_191887 [bioreactor metagenome]|uniref:Uncharacterized protein n=1 Tax=bioreactor metagenome TaxID=1076179 RepID=A0A645HZ61_9ZZZZ